MKEAVLNEEIQFSKPPPINAHSATTVLQDPPAIEEIYPDVVFLYPPPMKLNAPDPVFNCPPAIVEQAPVAQL
jgi:hypothetical protein